MLPRTVLRCLASLSVLAGATPLPLRSQDIPSPYRFIENRQEAGPFVGYLSPGTGRFGFGPGPGVYFGARYGLRASGPLGFEAVVGYLPTTRDLVDPTRAPGSRVVGKVDANIVTMDLQMRFSLTGDRTWHGLAPFLLAGGGGAFDVAGDSSAETLLLEQDRFRFKKTWLALLGGGLRWVPSERLSVRTDASLNLWRLTTPPGFRDPDLGLTGVGEKEWVSGPSISLGLAFLF